MAKCKEGCVVLTFACPTCQKRYVNRVRADRTHYECECGTLIDLKVSAAVVHRKERVGMKWRRT